MMMIARRSVAAIGSPYNDRNHAIAESILICKFDNDSICHNDRRSIIDTIDGYHDNRFTLGQFDISISMIETAQIKKGITSTRRARNTKSRDNGNKSHGGR